MPGEGVKQRKTRAAAGQNNGEHRDSQPPCNNSSVSKDGEKVNNKNVACGRSSAWAVDVKTGLSLLALTGCFLLAWVVFQQNAKFNEVEKKYNHLYEKTADLLVLGKKFSAVSEKCENVQMLLENQELQSPLSQLNSLEHKVSQLKEWSSGLTERRQKLQDKLSSLTQAVQRIENRTTAISSDVNAKVASVRTDVRRMGGLEADVEALLTQTSDLERRMTQAEKLMAKRIGELLAASIDRVSGLRSSTEKNTQSLEQIRKRLPELYAADKKLSEHILALESGRAKLVRTLTFASDLRPKMSTIKMDFAMLEPQLVDLTLRIGHLAEDVMKRENDIANIKDTLAKYSSQTSPARDAE